MGSGLAWVLSGCAALGEGGLGHWHGDQARPTRSGMKMYRLYRHKKTRCEAAGFFWAARGAAGSQAELLQFDFLVLHVLACLGIKFHDEHFFGRGFLVFGGRVKVTGAGGRFQLDFFACAFSHDRAP